MKIWSKFLLLTILIVTLSYLMVFSTVMDPSAQATNDNKQGVMLHATSQKEMEKQLFAEITAWQSSGDLLIESASGAINIPKSSFKFDMQATLTRLENELALPWYKFWSSKEEVSVSLVVSMMDKEILESYSSVIDLEETEDELLEKAASLSNDSVSGTSSGTNIAEDTVAIKTINIPADVGNVDEIASIVNKRQLSGNSPFSMLSFLEKESLDSEAINVVASALYAAFLQTNIEIIERHPFKEIPTFTQPGTEAEVSSQSMKDLRISNPNPFPMEISAVVISDRLEVSISSFPLPEAYEIDVVESTVIKPRIVKRYSDMLVAGKNETIQQGEDGLHVEIVRIPITGERRTITSVSTDYYPPIPEIREISIVDTQQNPVPEESPSYSSDIRPPNDTSPADNNAERSSNEVSEQVVDTDETSINSESMNSK